MRILISLCFVVLCLSNNAQSVPFDNCDTGSENSCRCSTAPRLCTVDDLDGFQFDMTGLPHPEDGIGPPFNAAGRSPLCPNPPNPPSGSDNPVWFAFTAWCTDLTIDVSFGTCTPGFTGNIGVQIAIYPGCTLADWQNAVACDINGAGCNANARQISMTGLTIGNPYYFVIDGCARSFCEDVTIDVVGVCGNDEIPFFDETDILGPRLVCAGETVTYTTDWDNVQDVDGNGFLDGASEYLWSVNSVPGTWTNSLTWDTDSYFELDNNFTTTWPMTPGDYEVCFDAGDKQCLPTNTSDPLPACFIVTVVAPDAGTITATPDPACPGDVVTITASGYSQDVGLANRIYVADASGTIVLRTGISTSNSMDTTFSHPTCADFTAYSFNYPIDPSYTPPIVGGNAADLLNCAAAAPLCCDAVSVPFSFADGIAPLFVTMPADITLTCINDTVAQAPIMWTDNCMGMGDVMPTQTGMITDPCTGGTLIRTWTITDSCGNTTTHPQTITVTPVPPPAFVNPPNDTTYACDAFPSTAPDLMWTNGATGSCELFGSASATLVGDTLICGSTYQFVWEFLNICDGSTISHTQNITITPALPVQWVNPPGPATFACPAAPLTAPDLAYSNGDIGKCLLEGTVPGVVQGIIDSCGRTYNFFWEYTDSCGVYISHSQPITIQETDPVDWVMTPPGDITVDCDMLPRIEDQSFLVYSNGLTGLCELTDTVYPRLDGGGTICDQTYFFVWDTLDVCGRPLSHTQTITVNVPPVASFTTAVPADVTINCANIDTNPLDLDYSNNRNGDCLFEGTATPILLNQPDICGGDYVWEWRFTDTCGMIVVETQTVTVDPPTPIALVNPPADNITIGCDDTNDYAIPLQYTNGETGTCEQMGTIVPTVTGGPDSCGTTYSITWDTVDFCGNIIDFTQMITVTPPANIDFISPPPATVTINCADATDFMQPLDYTNGETGQCLFMGTVFPEIISGVDDSCGGQYVIEWDTIVECGQVLNFQQTIIIDPPAPAAYDNPPGPQNISCDDVTDFMQPLTYTNGEAGRCLFEGTVFPTILSGMDDSCGGMYVIQWDTLIECGQQLTHTQTITIDPPTPADYVGAPTDITISCDDETDFLLPLTYTNGETGRCLFEGTVFPTILSGMDDSCGGMYVIQWDTLINCNQQLTHTQTISINPPTPADYVGAPTDITISCDDETDFLLPLMYTNGEAGRCLFEGTVFPTILSGMDDSCGGMYVIQWDTLIECGQQLTHTQTITIDPPTPADYVGAPTDITISCDDETDFLLPLMYTNGETGRCLFEGTVFPTILSGMDDSCGGMYVIQWDTLINCNQQLTHTQTITIDPPDLIAFINPPMNETVSCDNLSVFAPTLGYTNGEMGRCLFEGDVTPTITGSPDPCGSTYTLTWDTTDVCGTMLSHVQTIIVTPPQPIDFINPPPDITVSCDNTDIFDIPLNYTNGENGVCLFEGTVFPTVTGAFDSCGGTFSITWDTMDVCGNMLTYTQDITIDPPAPAAYINAPADETIDCADATSFLIPLSYSNGEAGACLFEGMVMPQIISGMDDSCGGQYVIQWDTIIACGQQLTHTQTIDITPPDPIAFTNPPSDQTVSCSDDVSTFLIPLDYTNNESGRCLFMGTVMPTITSGMPDSCGGQFVITWDTLDGCGNPLLHTQTITINPPAPIQYSMMPADQTVDCSDATSFLIPLDYTNGESGACLFEGTVIPTITSGMPDSCGGQYAITWDTIDGCGNALIHVQTITITPPDPIAYINPPADETVDCSADLAAYLIPLNYTNNESGQCLFDGTVIPSITSGMADSCGGQFVITWDTIDGCGNMLVHTQTIDVTPPDPIDFISPPADITVSCDNTTDFAIPLNYTNNEMGACLFEGTVIPTVNGQFDICGGTFSITWDTIDGCNNALTYTQMITVDPPPPIAFISPPMDITVACDAIPTSAPDLDYTNGGIGTCLFDGTVPATKVGEAGICGGQFAWEWTATDTCGVTITHTQRVTVDPAPPVAFVNPPMDVTVDCDMVPTTAPDLMYTNGASGDCLLDGSVPATQIGMVDFCGGNFSFLWQYTDTCGVTIFHSQNIVVNPAPTPSFVNLPADTSIVCIDIPTVGRPLAYTNNNATCAISGTVTSTFDGILDVKGCGGTFTENWEFTDPCGAVLTYSRTYTVTPAAEGDFVNPPADVTINCDDIPATPPTLQFTNGLSGLCQIQETVSPLISGSFDECGGQIVRTWTETDVCGRTKSVSQTVTVLPASDPQWISPPGPVTLACGVLPPLGDPLFYSNQATGDCEIAGSVVPSVAVNGLQTTYSWSFTSPCTGITITHDQVVTESIVPEIDINPAVDELCEGETYDLSLVPVIDVAGNSPTITIHSGSPASTANQIANLQVSPAVNTTYYFLATSPDGCTDEVAFDIVINPLPQSGEPGSIVVCDEFSTVVDLFDVLDVVYDIGGNWFDLDGNGMDISNPEVVFPSGNPLGFYDFYYIVTSPFGCPADTAVATIELVEFPELIIDSVVCTNFNTTYTVYITNPNAADIQVDRGVLDAFNTFASVSEIPITETVMIDYLDLLTQCGDVISINPPNCDCPTIPPPVAGPPVTACVGTTPAALTVVPNAQFIHNWYDAATGGNRLANDADSYNPPAAGPGTYTFYVESVLPSDTACVSTTRTPVQLTFLAGPTVNDLTFEQCDQDNDGFNILNLVRIATVVSGSANTVTFHTSAADALSGNAQLPIGFINTSIGTQIIYTRVVDPNGCVSTGEVEVILINTPTVTVQQTDETCDGDNDGTATITVTDGIPPYEYTLDGINWLPLANLTGLSPDLYNLEVRDSKSCSKAAPFTIQEGVSLQITGLLVVCNDNGSNTDPNDDFYDVSLTVNSNVAGSSFTLTVGATTIGTYTAGTPISFTLPADGSSNVLTVTSANGQCSDSQPMPTLTSCSSDCDIDFTVLSDVCNDNGTESDPSDDFYTITVDATVANGASNNQFDLQVNGVTVATYTYGTGGSYQLPADGTSPQITIVDNEDLACVESQVIGPLNSCSGSCLVNLQVLSEVCNDNGTEIETDDFYEIVLSLSGFNLSGSGTITVDGVTVATTDFSGNDTLTIGADGNTHIITVTDDADPTCTATYTTAQLTDCSNPCITTLVSQSISACDNNGTNNTADDDTFSVTFRVDKEDNGIASVFTVSDGTNLYGPFNYGEDITINGLPADASNITLTTTDSQSSICSESLTVSQAPCSVCTQTVEAGPNQTISCGMPEATLSGSASDPGVERWTGPNSLDVATNPVTVLVPGWYYYSVTYNDGCVALDSVEVIQDTNDPTVDGGPNLQLTCDVDQVTITATTNLTSNFEINWYDNEGNLLSTGPSITVSQADTLLVESVNLTNNCASPQSQVIVFDHPDLEIDINVISAVCDNNGTPSDPSDDSYTISYTTTSTIDTIPITSDVSEVGSSSISAGDTITFVTAATDGSLTITINANQGSCTADEVVETISLPNCSSDCLVEITQLMTVCEGNGTPSDPSDDTYTVTFVGTGANASAANTFDCLVNGVSQGIFMYGDPVTLSLPANGASPSISIVDTEVTGCSDLTIIGPLVSCSDACAVTLDVLTIICSDNGTELDTDDFYTVSLIATGVNAGSTYNLLLDGATIGNYAYNGTQTITIPADNAVHLLAIEDIDDALCTDSFTTDTLSSCSVPCIATIVTQSISNCDDNGTGNTSDDDTFSVTLEITKNDNGILSTYSVTDSSMVWGPFDYGTVIVIEDLPSDGQPIVLTIFDSQSAGCTQSITVQSTPCSSCDQVVEAGPDQVTSCATPSVPLTGSIVTGSGSTGERWTGPDGFDDTANPVFVNAPGTYYFEVTFDDGCVAIDSVNVTVNAGDPTVDAGADQALTCLVGQVMLTATTNLSSDFTIIWTDVDGNVISNNATITTNTADTFFVQVINDINGCASSTDRVVVTDHPPLEIAFADLSLVCNDSGTPSDDSDDIYEVTFTITTSIAGASVDIALNGTVLSTVTDGQTVDLNLPADGSNVALTANSTLGSCVADALLIPLGALPSCSNSCELTLVSQSQACNNNNTTSNSADDFHTITIEVTALNGSASGYTVNVGGSTFGPFTYGATETFDLPADGTTPTLDIVDNDEAGCTLQVGLQPVVPCSENCFITLSLIDLQCNDQGTDLTTDDTYSITFSASGFNTGSGYELSLGGVVDDTYLYDSVYTIEVAANDVALVMLAVDVDDAACTSTVTTDVLSPCSIPCEISEVLTTIGACDNAGTNNTDTDDIFSVTIELTKEDNGVNSTYTVMWNGRTYGPFEYGQPYTIDSLPADGSSVILTTSDSESTLCSETITVSQLPCSECVQTVDAGTSTLLSCTDPTTDLAATSSEVGTYNWSGPNGTVSTMLTATVDFPGTYFFTATYSDGCVAIDSVEVMIDVAAPFVQASEDQLLTCVVDSVELSAVVNLSSNFLIEWIDSLGNVISTDPTITVSEAGTYAVQVTDLTNNCTSPQDFVVVAVDRAEPTAIILADPGNILDCVVEVIAITSDADENTVLTWTYNNQTFQTDGFTVDEPGTIGLLAIDTLTGCIANDELVISTIEEYPIIDLVPELDITCVDQVVTLDATSSQSGDNISYEWTDIVGNVVAGDTLLVEVSEPGTYYITGIDSNNGCTNTDTVVVNDNANFPNLVAADQAVIDCDANDVSITATANVANDGSISWTTTDGSIAMGSDPLTILADAAGQYIITIDNGDGCIESDTVDVEQLLPPESSEVAATDFLCEGESDGQLEITQVTGGTPPYTYSINGAAPTTQTSFDNLQGGVYSIVVTDDNGCTYTSEVTIDILPGPNVDLVPVLVATQGDVITLEVDIDIDTSQIAQIIWTPNDGLSCDDCLNPTLLSSEVDQEFSVTVIDIFGCESMATIRVDVQGETIFTVPNIFNPESSSGNNGFTVYTNENVEVIDRLLVYDRWGNLVFINENFAPNDINLGWDGTYRGKPVVQGVYVFVLQFSNVEGVEFNDTGDVTIIR